VLLAANAAMFDHLAQGRFILGVSAGALGSDAEALGILDEDRNKMFAEAIDVILAIWQREPPYDIDFADNRYKVAIKRAAALHLGVGEDDDDSICEREELAYTTPLEEPGRNSDLDGDGRADVCRWHAREGTSSVVLEGVSCAHAGTHGLGETIVGPEARAASVLESSTLRTADVDGDGLADVCLRLDDRLVCVRSGGRALTERVIGPPWPQGAPLWLADVDGDGAADACLRGGTGLVCHRGFGQGRSDAIALAALSDAAGFVSIVHYGSIRFGDVDGDGRDDVCARGADGLDCWLSRGDRFGAIVRGPRWRDVDGWDALSRWSTIRLADVDGDGRLDVCGRASEGFVCALIETGAGEGSAEPRFGRLVRGPSMPDADGWDRPEQYATLRLADLDGDGRDDLCARDRDGIACWHASERGFERG
jgi:hypothetical protein